MASTHAAKERAIEQWSADPCGPVVDGEPGSRTYFEQLLAGRQQYAPWMSEALGYDETRGQSVLDVGCGQGLDLVQYAQAGADVVGVDLTPRHVDLARAHLGAMGLSGTVVKGDAESLTFEDASFDRASSNGVLHHTPDMPAALRELHRVLRPRGTVRIIVYNRSSLHYWLHQVLAHGVVSGKLLKERSMTGVMSRTVERTSIGARPLVRAYTPRQVRGQLSSAGFSEVMSGVRHFRASDTIPTRVLARLLPAFRDRRLLDRIGRVAGWYVVGTGQRAPS